MSLSFRPFYLLLAAACLFLALVISPSASGQAGTATVKQGQSAQPEPQTPTASSDPIKEDWMGQIHEYERHLRLVADECGDFQRHIEEGKERDKESFWGNYVVWLRLREDEAQEMCNIFIDTDNRTRDMRNEYYAANGGRLHTWGSDPHNVKGLAVYRQELIVIEEAISKLKRDFGEEDFKKLDGDLQRSYLSGRKPSTEAQSPVTASGSRQPEDKPAPVQVPEARP